MDCPDVCLKTLWLQEWEWVLEDCHNRYCWKNSIGVSVPKPCGSEVYVCSKSFWLCLTVVYLLLECNKVTSWVRYNMYPVIPGRAEKKTPKHFCQDCGLRPTNWTQDPHSPSVSNEATAAMNTSKDAFIQHIWRTLQVPVLVDLFISGRTCWHEVRIFLLTTHSKLHTRSWQSWPTVFNEAPRRVGAYGGIRVVVHIFNITLHGGAWLA
jgi:hypothetical protein